jgi:hypothetical protein
MGELVWLRNPEGGLNNLPWEEKVITNGPESIYDVIPGSSDSIILFAAEFFTKKLTVYEISTKTGLLLRSKVIDDTIDFAYSVKYINLTGNY